MSAYSLALALLPYVPAADRERALRQARDQLDAEGSHADSADCARLLRDVEALRPREAVQVDRKITEEDGA